ncbi:endonuclease [Acetobacter aceti]|uniref:Endonuclease n=1 Tax=Acetobacter aceti TaxID=435 RepID=A0A1U9KGD7_ACEAC|nr:endonuclease [Acetobacter aceti]
MKDTFLLTGRRWFRTGAIWGVIWLSTLFPQEGRCQPLRITTWNMSWLTARPASDPALPEDIYHRSPDDVRRLTDYARRVDADIVGFQEVDGPEIAARVFPPTRYHVYMTSDPVVQRVGVAVRNSLAVERHPDLTDLNVYPPSAPHPLRSGLDITVSDGKASLRILVLHLKTGCWDNPPDERKHACPTLRRQYEIISDWILERQDEGEAFAIMGDFNRRMTPGDPFFLELSQSAPLLLTTAGRASPCWGGEYFIDHILLGGQASGWLVPDSLRVMTFKGVEETPRNTSDHCPVSVELSPP